MANCERCIRRCGSRGQPVTIDCDKFLSRVDKKRDNAFGVKNRAQAEELATAITKVAFYRVTISRILVEIVVQPSLKPDSKYVIGFEIPKCKQKTPDDSLRHYSYVQDEIELKAELSRIITSYYMEES